MEVIVKLSRGPEGHCDVIFFQLLLRLAREESKLNQGCLGTVYTVV